LLNELLEVSLLLIPVLVNKVLIGLNHDEFLLSLFQLGLEFLDEFHEPLGFFESLPLFFTGLLLLLSLLRFFNLLDFLFGFFLVLFSFGLFWLLILLSLDFFSLCRLWLFSWWLLFVFFSFGFF
jgi:hypothetical protein